MNAALPFRQVFLGQVFEFSFSASAGSPGILTLDDSLSLSLSVFPLSFNHTVFSLHTGCDFLQPLLWDVFSPFFLSFEVTMLLHFSEFFLALQALSS